MRNKAQAHEGADDAGEISVAQTICRIISRKRYLLTFGASLVVSLILYSFLQGAWTLPGIGFGIARMSPLELSDYAFIAAAGLLLALFVTLWRYERDALRSSGAGGGSTSGTIAGILAGACPYCHAIGITALGSTVLSIPIGPIVPYLGVLKVVSLGAMLLAVVLKAEGIQGRSCAVCVVGPRKTLRYGVALLAVLLIAGIISVNLWAGPVVPYEPLPPDLVVRQYYEALGRQDYRDAFNTFSDGFKAVQPSARNLTAYEAYAASLGIARVNVTALEQLSNDGHTATVRYAAMIEENGTARNVEGTHVLKYRKEDLIEGWKLLQPYGDVGDNG